MWQTINSKEWRPSCTQALYSEEGKKTLFCYNVRFTYTHIHTHSDSSQWWQTTICEKQAENCTHTYVDGHTYMDTPLLSYWISWNNSISLKSIFYNDVYYKKQKPHDKNRITSPLHLHTHAEMDQPTFSFFPNPPCKTTQRSGLPCLTSFSLSSPLSLSLQLPFHLSISRTDTLVTRQQHTKPHHLFTAIYT